MNRSNMAWMIVGVVWFANVNDLIRGTWFFESITAIVFWNAMMLLALIFIILDQVGDLKEMHKENDRLRSIISLDAQNFLDANNHEDIDKKMKYLSKCMDTYRQHENS